MGASALRRLTVAAFATVVWLGPPRALAGFPGANGLIAFESDRDGNDDIWVVNPDGTGLRNLTNHPADDREPQWSPDGTRLVFRRGDDGEEREIWVMNADGSGQARLTENDVEDEKPSWSADGSEVVFETDRDGEKQVYVIRRDGTVPRNLSDDLSAAAKEPVWSPDDALIAYRRQDGDGDTREIWVMNPDGSGKTQLTFNDAEDEDPGWSPDGSRIVFESDRDGPKQIYVMNADGTNQRRVAITGSDEVDPEWSPDGTKIVFRSERDGDGYIYVMNVDGTEQVRIGEQPGDGNPSWQPIPTTTTTQPPTTTTTLPGGGMPLPGKKLLLKDNAAKPRKRALKLLAKDPAIGLGSTNGSAGDPTIDGGFLKVVSRTGDVFTRVYDLPAGAWRYKGKEGKNKGYKLTSDGPIRKAIVKLKKGSVKIIGKGEDLRHTLGADPEPVHVALGLGAATYCFSFGGRTKFKPGKKYVATKAPAAACAALEPECGDGVVEPGESCSVLDGPPDGPAIDATSNHDDEPGLTPDEIEEEAPGVELARTRLEIEFAPTSTVAEVEAVLTALDAEIVMMVRGAPLLLVRIPDPGSLAALDAVIAAAATTNVHISKSYFHDIDVLPRNFDPPRMADLSAIDSLLSVHAPAAWNARGAIQAPPMLLIADSFGDGPPNGDVDAVLLDPSDFETGDQREHGYHVLGIAAARFGAAAFCASPGPLSPAVLRGCVTGMMPGTVPLRVVDLRERLTILGTNMRLVLRALVLGNVVVNTSLNACCQGTCGDLVVAGDAARRWAQMVRGAGLENGMLHLTSAGNIDSPADPNPCKDPADFDAVTNSEYTAAALHPAIPDFVGTGTIPNLTNTLVVENVQHGGNPDFAPLCMRISSKRPGQISGIGTTVLSHIDSGTAAGNKGGTSMSTPQVAGLAAYLWAIDPSMTVAELRGLLQETAEAVPAAVSGGCDPLGTQARPIIDAYAAVLALDDTVPPTPLSAPVRHAILDVDADGDFDELDVFDIVGNLFDLATGEPREPTDPTWQRFDLNGDGYTGGASRHQPFDLDRVGSTRYGSSQLDQISQTVEGASIPFDETVVTDLDVLCYYAYSGLYAGDTNRRRAHLGLARCARLDMTVTFASEITPGTPEPLTVSVGREGQAGSEPVEDVYIEISPLGGTATPSTGTTNAQGELVSQIRLDPGSTFVEIVVQALTGPGGEVLAEEVVSAGAPCTDMPTMVQLDFGTGEPDPTVVGPTLQDGAEYRLTASGTYSIWTFEWQNGTCKGTPTGGSGGSTGLDAEYWFAIPVGSALCGGGFDCCPHHSDKFRISLDDGGGFDHVEPVVEDYTTSHVYEYRIRGRGQPVHFMLEESSARGDDYGILELQIACASDTTTTTTTTTTSSSTTTTTSTSSTSSTSPTVSITTTTATSTTSTSTTLFVVPVVPYARYVATGPDGPVVMLADEFATESIDLGAVGLELPPVAIDGLLPPDPDTHQTCWLHPGGLLDTCIDVQDQFGLAPLRVGNPVAVCVPELSPSIAVDAFKCYQATGTPIDEPVSLEDEFQTQAVMVGAPELLCAPVEVDGDPLTNAGRYLVCYATTPVGAAGGQVGVENALSGGPIQVDVGAATGLCVPALRQLVATCQLCGNGVPEGDEECDDGNVAAGDGCSPVCRLEP